MHTLDSAITYSATATSWTLYCDGCGLQVTSAVRKADGTPLRNPVEQYEAADAAAYSHAEAHCPR